jgi:hypothetical protein
MRAVTIVTLVSLAAVPAAAQSKIPPREEQIRAAVLPLPEEMRAKARVLGYDASGTFGLLREGSGMICLAQYPREPNFHVSCYHESLEPFMARGRELRATGTAANEVDSVRYREARSGKLKLPAGPAALYQIFGGTLDPVAGTVTGGRRLYVVYVPYATGASTGLPEKPHGNDPWLMSAGTPKAHIMFTTTM